MEDQIINEEDQFIFEDFLKVLDEEDTFKTYGLMFESTLEVSARQNLCEKPMTEKRNGVRAVSDEVLQNQNSFYTVGAFLKLLKELGFTVEETLEEECDFCGTLWANNYELQISVEFSYGTNEVEYKVQYIDSREETGNPEDLLKEIFGGSTKSNSGFNNYLTPQTLYDDLETFMRDFRRSWKRHNDHIKEMGQS